jgi:hypothetical protein
MVNVNTIFLNQHRIGARSALKIFCSAVEDGRVVSVEEVVIPSYIKHKKQFVGNEANDK